jgi:hypothetical protein
MGTKIVGSVPRLKIVNIDQIAQITIVKQWLFFRTMLAAGSVTFLKCNVKNKMLSAFNLLSSSGNGFCSSNLLYNIFAVNHYEQICNIMGCFACV